MSGDPVSFPMNRSLLSSMMAAVRALAVWIPISAEGMTYFVASSGDDLDNGSESSPWKTLQHAADTVAPGDTVIVRPGNYQGFDLRTSGTGTDRIYFTAEAGVVIDQDNPVTIDGINLEGVSHVTLEGFTVMGATRAGIRVVGALNEFSKQVTVRRNCADQNGKWGIFTGFCDDLLIEDNDTSRSGVEHGIYVSNSGDRPVVRRNTVWGNNASGIQLNADASLGGDGIISNAIIEANTIYDNGSAGGAAINCDGVQDSIIRNNLLYHNHSTGIALFRIDGAEGAKRNLVVNNTVVVASDGRWAVAVKSGSTDNTFRNNIFYNHHAFRGTLEFDASSLPGLDIN